MPDAKRIKTFSAAKKRARFPDADEPPRHCSTYGGWGLLKVHYIPTNIELKAAEGEMDVVNNGLGGCEDTGVDHGATAARQKETDEEKKVWKVLNNAKSGLSALMREQDWPTPVRLVPEPATEPATINVGISDPFVCVEIPNVQLVPNLSSLPGVAQAQAHHQLVPKPVGFSWESSSTPSLLPQQQPPQSVEQRYALPTLVQPAPTLVPGPRGARPPPRPPIVPPSVPPNLVAGPRPPVGPPLIRSIPPRAIPQPAVRPTPPPPSGWAHPPRSGPTPPRALLVGASPHDQSRQPVCIQRALV